MDRDTDSTVDLRAARRFVERASVRPREGDLIRDRLAGMDVDRERLFRINAGLGWAGSTVRKVGAAMLIKDARPLRAAPEGWPDLCGWETVEVTQDMVGRRLAVFVGEEFKTSGGLRPEQARFRDVLLRMGGVYRVVRP